jgi:type IV pilus assembly protein PilM
MTTSSTLIVNCGVSHVSASVFSSGDDGILRLEEVRFAQLTHDFSIEDEWLGGVEAGLIELKKTYGLGGETHFILPGSLLLTKTIRVPHVEESKQDQIVTFELQQKMPYPLAELVWGYQAVEDDGVEQEVLAAAVRPAIAEAFCERMDEIGFRPVELSAASILDYNAMRHSHIDLRDGEMLVINVGAKSSNLLFINPEGFLIRNIGLGGNSLTQHIADNLGTSFVKAEDVKIRYFSGKTAFAEDDPGVAIMQKNAGQFMTRLSQEVTRSVVTYKRLKKGKAPARVFLTGRGSLLPGLPEYLSETQGLSVDYFDPLRAIRVSEDVADEILQEAVFMLSEVVGEAGRQFNMEGLKGIDLLPKDKKIQMSFRPKRLFLMAASLLLALIPVPGLLQNLANIETMKLQADEWNAAINTAETEAQNRASDEDELKVTRELNEALLADMQPFGEMLSASQNWKALLADLHKGLMKVGHIWIDDLSLARLSPSGAKQRPRAREEVSDGGPIQYELKISGRFLVPKPGDFANSSGLDPDRNSSTQAVAGTSFDLQTLNSARLDAFTKAMQDCEFVEEIKQKNSETRGRGDLQGRRFTFFDYIIVTKPDRPL